MMVTFKVMVWFRDFRLLLTIIDVRKFAGRKEDLKFHAFGLT